MDEKWGLALSGGGFRASLFHIGVLARLAEVDLLRQIDVISTVSGGSIVGAYYYLKVKELLECKRSDGPPSSDSYVRIVQEIERDFLAAVQKNLRTRAFWNPYRTAQMLVSDDYSRSDRMSELYRKHLYLPLWRRVQKDDSLKHIPLHEIKIYPPDLPPDFDPREYNRSAEFKVPILIINATTLNTGHSWHFTSSWVGEPGRRTPSIDTNFILRQLRFAPKKSASSKDAENLSEERKRARREKLENDLWLGDAVAASACVPGVFAPMPIHDLYWSKKGEGPEIVVELVDGGVFDNQGMDALRTENCKKIICSDACGQLEDERAPASGALAVATRSNSISMDRARGLEFESFSTSWGSNLAFFHLREEFPDQPGYPPFPGPVDVAKPDRGFVYRLSNIRTDLDSFSQLEAFSLMYDGYCLSNHRLAERRMIPSDTLPPRTGEGNRWRFLEITGLLDGSDLRQRKRLLKHLTVGKANAFKVFRLLDPAAIALAAILVAVAAWVVSLLWSAQLSLPAISFSVSEIVTGIVLAGLLALLKALDSTETMKFLLDNVRWIRRRHWLLPLYAIMGVVLIVVTAVVTVHVLVFDRLYLRAGRIKS